MTYREAGKKWKLPDRVSFEPGAGIPYNSFKRYFFYEILGYRKPKRGEHYLSGAIPGAYRARADLDQRYLVVRATHKAVQRIVYVRGEAI